MAMPEDAPPAGRALAPGARVGRYQVLSLLGVGGMGEVYRARDLDLHRDVALKVLPPDRASSTHRVARFEREARTLAALNHPHIAQVHAVADAEGVRAIVMELVEGEPLTDRIARGPIPVDEALALAQQIADALDAAHEAGIVHRDLKPANVHVRPDGTVKVLDFGLAKAIGGACDDTAGHALQATLTVPMTGADVILGTPAYMSPEQTRGVGVDKRADIWAFGCVLYEMLSGRRAFSGEHRSDVIAKVIERDPDFDALPAPIPPAVRALVERCLVKDARARLRDIGDARLEIEAMRASLIVDPTRRARRTANGDVRLVLADAERLDALERLTLPSQPSVAVLPFGFAGDEPAHGVLADGLTHELITRLARVRWLFVISRGSAFRFRAGPYDARDVGRALGVRYVVQGDVRVVGAEISVHAVLADATTGRECWAEHLHRPMRDVLTIQEEIAGLVVGSVESEIEHGERHRAAIIAPANLDAWSAYYRGCWHMYRFTEEDYELAEQFFRRSIEFDPRSPCAFAGLSFIHWQRAFLELTPHRAGEERRALDFAQQALALDPRDPLGHWALGRAYLLSDDLDQAVDELETAVQLNPSSASGQYALSYALMQTGDSERSNDVVARAQRLSPYDVMTFAMHAVRAQNLAFLGQYAESAAFATRAARQPNAHYQVLAIAAYCNVLAGRVETARVFYERLRAVRPAYTSADFLRAFRHQPRDHTALVERAFRQLEQVR